MFNVWDRIEENVFADDVTNALAKIFPNDPPRFLARTPHGYHDTALIRSELEDAGFSRVVIETRAEQSRASSPRHSGHCLLSGNSSSQRNRGQRRGKTGSRNRLRRIRDCEQTRQRTCDEHGHRRYDLEGRNCQSNIAAIPIKVFDDGFEGEADCKTRAAPDKQHQKAGEERKRSRRGHEGTTGHVSLTKLMLFKNRKSFSSRSSGTEY